MGEFIFILTGAFENTKENRQGLAGWTVLPWEQGFCLRRHTGKALHMMGQLSDIAPKPAW